jgi:hypothetical protein
VVGSVAAAELWPNKRTSSKAYLAAAGWAGEGRGCSQEGGKQAKKASGYIIARTKRTGLNHVPRAAVQQGLPTWVVGRGQGWGAADLGCKAGKMGSRMGLPRAQRCCIQNADVQRKQTYLGGGGVGGVGEGGGLGGCFPGGEGGGGEGGGGEGLHSKQQIVEGEVRSCTVTLWSLPNNGTLQLKHCRESSPGWRGRGAAQ